MTAKLHGGGSCFVLVCRCDRQVGDGPNSEFDHGSRVYFRGSKTWTGHQLERGEGTSNLQHDDQVTWAAWASSEECVTSRNRPTR